MYPSSCETFKANYHLGCGNSAPFLFFMVKSYCKISVKVGDQLMKRITNRKAFTLAELLIVVAIIAVLVGISIPIFTAQREKSAEAVDIANMRSAKSAIIELYYAGIDSPTVATSYGLYWYNYGKSDENIWGVYDAATGKFISANGYDNLRKKLTPYGQGTPKDGGTDFFGYDGTLDYTDSVITVTIYPKGLTAAQLAKINGGKEDYSSYANVPCIVLEWRHCKDRSYVGRASNDKSPKVCQIVFIEE